jgi:hypothetical protein
MEQYNRFVIITPKSMSESARSLKEELQKYINAQIILVSPKSTTYQARWADYVVNWGYSKRTNYVYLNAANGYWDISNAVNKLTTFKILRNMEVQTVEWTDDPIVAAAWWEEGNVVIGRETLTGFGGTGIVIFEETKPHENCQLYTKYKKKKNEYRVHVFKDEVIDITQKKKKVGAPTLNTKVRNHHNGWVYCRSDIHVPNDLSDLALKAVKALGLTHGAVDIIWNEKENKCYVLEVNTAPGLVGTTLIKYAQVFSKDFNK